MKKEAVRNPRKFALDTNQWLVLLNPNAGCGKGKEDKDEIIRCLDSYKLHYTLVTSDFPKHAICLTVKYIEIGYRNIIVCGGDGTLNEVVNGVFIQEATSSKNITLGVIPVGTGNDWGKTFGIPFSYMEAVKTIVGYKIVEQDIDKIVYTGGNEKRTRYFANIAGFGFDAMVARNANKLKEKGKKGVLVYILSLVGSFMNYKISKAKISIDSNETEEYLFSASIGIGRFNGGGMMQAPFAVPNNGKFQVTVVKKIGFWGILKNLKGLYTGEFVKDKRVSVYNCKQVSIVGETTIQGEVDGESLGNSAFHIEMLNERLRIIYGNDKYLDKSTLEETGAVSQPLSQISVEIQEG